ncbi:hypothetical protein Syun_018366 [Stephania yunnanensis]|uniref:Uncharacterized protein n=1 Tax=Stephania yunnanensis TaxID=152371 RepID=A0AAP0IS60_9MAGN
MAAMQNPARTPARTSRTSGSGGQIGESDISRSNEISRRADPLLSFVPGPRNPMIMFSICSVFSVNSNNPSVALSTVSPTMLTDCQHGDANISHIRKVYVNTTNIIDYNMLELLCIIKSGWLSQLRDDGLKDFIGPPDALGTIRVRNEIVTHDSGGAFNRVEGRIGKSLIQDEDLELEK